MRFSAVLDLIYRPRCVACDGAMTGPGLCSPCLETIIETSVSCPRCARPIAGPLPLVCARCATSQSPLDSLTAPFEYGGQLAVALKRLKYGRRSDVARGLAPLLEPAFRSVAARCEVAIVVPLHWRRLARRGYNQAERLLTALRRRAAIDTAPGLVQRVRATREQASLPASERAANVAGAFRIDDPGAVRGKRVLLLDDITTTGNTLRAVAEVLRAAGAAEVHATCAARAPMC